MEPSSNIFDSSNFMPHGHCFLWQPNIFWLHLLSDIGIATAYFGIPLVLIYIMRKRKDLPFENVFFLFAAFIVLCGSTHLMSIRTLWHPEYGIEGLIKAATAIVSIATFLVLVKMIPRMLMIPGPAQFRDANQQLQDASYKLEKLYQQTRADSESYLQAIVNTVLDGLITIDAGGIIRSFNPAAEKIFGYTAAEVIGQNVKMLMPNPYHSEHDGYLKNYLATGERKVIGIGREVSGRRKDGSVFPMELGINEMKLEDTRMFVGTVRDISHRRQAEEDIQQYLTALKRSNQELDDFAYIASHDLKEPLRGLSNNANFLTEDFGKTIGEDGIKRLGRMTYLCERMERLVNDLLYFSRLGRQELAVQKTDLNDVIHDIESMMEATLHESNAKIVVPQKLPTIVCDLPRITEAYRNLITNAVKYNDKPEKIVEVGVTEQDGKRVFYVRDNGIGIDASFYDDVFRIFKRLNDEDDNVKGTGVGLTFVKKIIERHKGRIWIESEMGKGTSFYFTIREPKEA